MITIERPGLEARRASLVAVTLAALAFQSSAAPSAGGWHVVRPDARRRVALVAMRGTGPGGPCDATLTLMHFAEVGRVPVTKGGATEMPVIAELWLSDAKQAAPFDLDDFEGPEAPAGSLKLVSVTLSTKGKTWKWNWTAGGWYSPLADPTGITGDRRPEDPQAFVFGLGNPFRDYRELVQFVDALEAGAQSLTIEIAARNDRASRLRFEVPLDAAVDAVRELMAPVQAR